MLQRIKIALAIMLIASSPAIAHGGGGGGGHGGGHGGTYVYSYYGGGGEVLRPEPAVTGDYSNIHTIAILSSIGTQLTLGSVGLFSTHTDIDISGWGWNLDDWSTSNVRGYLGSRFTVKDVSYDRAGLARIPNGHFDTSSAKALHDYLGRLNAGGVDAFVIVRSDAEGSSRPTPGLSINVENGRTVEVANYEIDVVDAKTGNIIAHSISRMAFREKAPADYAAIFGPQDLALSSKDTPSDAQRAKMKLEFTKLLTVSLLETVRSLNFGVTLPGVGGREVVPMPADKAAAIKGKTVAVVSAIGDTFSIAERATFGGVSSAVYFPIPLWQIDAHVEATMRDALSKRLKIKDLTVNRDAVYKARINFAPGATNGPIPGLPTAQDIDLYVVILKHAPAESSPVCMGLGIFANHGWLATSASDYACYDFVLVDPKTAKPVTAVVGTLSPKWPMALPMEVIDGALAPKPPAGLTPDQSDKLQAKMIAYLDDSIPEMMLRFGLTDMTIRYIPGARVDKDLGASESDATAPPPPGAQPPPPRPAPAPPAKPSTP